MSTISIFVFDCLPEVAAGITGALIFTLVIYLLQKKYFNQERILKTRREKGQCPACGSGIHRDDHFCSNCGTEIEHLCPACGGHNLIYNRFCKECGTDLRLKPIF